MNAHPSEPEVHPRSKSFIHSGRLPRIQAMSPCNSKRAHEYVDAALVEPRIDSLRLLVPDPLIRLARVGVLAW